MKKLIIILIIAMCGLFVADELTKKDCKCGVDPTWGNCIKPCRIDN